MSTRKRNKYRYGYRDSVKIFLYRRGVGVHIYDICIILYIATITIHKLLIEIEKKCHSLRETNEKKA